MKIQLFSHGEKINKGGGETRITAGRSPVQPHRRPAMAVQTESDGKREAMRGSLSARPASSEQREGSGVTETFKGREGEEEEQQQKRRR